MRIHILADFQTKLSEDVFVSHELFWNTTSLLVSSFPVWLLPVQLNTFDTEMNFDNYYYNWKRLCVLRLENRTFDQTFVDLHRLLQL